MPMATPAGGAPRSSLKGIAFILTSGFCAIAMHAAVRQIADSVHPFEIAFFRNLFGFAVLLPMLWRAGGLAALKTRRPGLHGLRSLFNTMGMLAYFMALTLAPLGDVTALSFTSPLFAMLGAVLVLGERAGPRRWAGLLLGFLGMLIILRPGGEAVGLGAFLALGASAAWACAMLTIKVLGRSETSLVITAYAASLMTLATLPPALFVWTWPDLRALGFLVLIGVLGSATQLALAQAFKEADASLVLPFDFAKLIWAALIGYLLFAEIPDLWTWVGGSVIAGSAIYIAYRERRAGGTAVRDTRTAVAD